MPGFGFADDGFGVMLNQFPGRREHSRRYQVETGPGNKPGNDPAGARFAHRVRRDDGVSEFLDLHESDTVAAVYERRKILLRFRRSQSARIATHFPRRCTCTMSILLRFRPRLTSRSCPRKTPERISHLAPLSRGKISISNSLKRFAMMMSIFGGNLQRRTSTMRN